MAVNDFVCHALRDWAKIHKRFLHSRASLPIHNQDIALSCLLFLFKCFTKLGIYLKNILKNNWNLIFSFYTQFLDRRGTEYLNITTIPCTAHPLRDKSWRLKKFTRLYLFIKNYETLFLFINYFIYFFKWNKNVLSIS